MMKKKKAGRVLMVYKDGLHFCKVCYNEAVLNLS